MRGFAGRRDTTHAPIRDGLRAMGWTVLDIADVGDAGPDLIAGKGGDTYLVECKSPRKKETPKQAQKRQTWRGGPWIVAFSVEDVLSEHRKRGHAA